MKRRDFLAGVGSVIAGSTLPLPWSNRYANAFGLSAISSAFSVISGVSGFLGRGSNPTIPLLISLSETVEALGLKVDAIDEKIDLILAEIFAIRQLVENIPYETQMLGLSIEMREPYKNFLELKPETHMDAPSEAYLRAIPPIRDRMRIARIKYLDVASSKSQNAHEAILQVALAQDSELILALEMQRTEMHQLGLAEDLTATLGALEAYSGFFDAAMNPDDPTSLAGLKNSLAKDVQSRLSEKLLMDRQYLQSAWSDPTPARYALLKEILVGGGETPICSVSGSLCLQSGNGPNNCAEPGFVRVLRTNITAQRTVISDAPTDVHDPLGMPYLYDLSGGTTCGSGANASSIQLNSQLVRAVRDLNIATTNFYKIHYAHAVCELAKQINSDQQRFLRSLLNQ